MHLIESPVLGLSFLEIPLRDAQQLAGATGTSFAQTTLVRPRSAVSDRLNPAIERRFKTSHFES